MLYLIHGGELEASRNKLVELKNLAKDKEIRELDGKKLDKTELTQSLESSSMFGGDVLVVIEGFISNAKKREKVFTETISRLVSAAESVDIVLYESKEIDKTVVAKLGNKAQEYLFKTPVVIFQFLDGLTLPLLQNTLATEPAEIVYVLTLRRVRQLIQVKENITPEGLQSWQATRLTNQAKRFTMDELVAMHAKLVETDIAIKTGSSPYTLAQHLEQFVISL